MNREAAALGVPVYTTFGGRLGGVDEELIREGRLRPLTDPRALELEKRAAGRRASASAATRSCCSTCSCLPLAALTGCGYAAASTSFNTTNSSWPNRPRRDGPRP